MHIQNHTLNQFISPDNSNRQEVESLVQKVVSQLLDFLADASNKATNPTFKLLGTSHFQIPNVAQTNNEIQASLQELYELSINPANPKYIGHMDSLPTTWSVIGDFIASALNNNPLSLEMSPFITQLEYSLTKQFATIFGLPETAGGVLLSGGTMCNMQALIVARNLKFNIKNGNVFSIKKEPVIFASEFSHISIQKIGMMIGIGMENVIKVKTDENSKIDIQDLELKINEQIGLGKQPFAIVATAGTTVSGNVDPLQPISLIAKKYDLWFHIDATYGGAVIFSDKYKSVIDGADQADSITFNPQKWMYVAKTCAMILFRDFDIMTDNFRISAPYMKGQNNYINLGEINVQGTKYAEVVKLWLSLQSLGKNGYEELIDYSYFLTDEFEKEINKRPFLKLVSQPQMNILCFRGEPTYIKPEKFDTWNENLQLFLVTQPDFFLSLPRYKNNLWLRTVLLNPFLTIQHIKTLFIHIDGYEQSTRDEQKLHTT